MDRALPEKVTLKRVEKPVYAPEGDGEDEKRKERGDLRRFDGVSVKEVVMAKLHTGELERVSLTLVRPELTKICIFFFFGGGGCFGRCRYGRRFEQRQHVRVRFGRTTW